MSHPEAHRASIEKHSRSFALASRLLPREAARDAAVVYAWCRRADDAIDESERETAPRTLVHLRRELGELYSAAGSSAAPRSRALSSEVDVVNARPADAELAAFGRVLWARHIPYQYPSDLLAGIEMDVTGHRYAAYPDLLVYCYRVASTVGLMMCHVMGVSDAAALRPAAHLGIAMQLTNICRDVSDDWRNGRLYLPDELLARHGAAGLAGDLGRPFPATAALACRGAIRELLALADGYYRSSDRGLDYLSFRCALGVNAARRIYSAIGAQLARQDWDPRAPRAIVSGPEKAWWCARALCTALALRRRKRTRPVEAKTLPTVQYGTELIPL